MACEPLCLRAQSSEKAYGIRAGYGMVLSDTAHPIVNVFYDIPIGDVMFSPELVVYMGANYAYGFNMKLKLDIHRGITWSWTADAGVQFMTWVDKAHIGVPIDIATLYRLSDGVQLEATANYTPLFFLGHEPDHGLVSILGGVRILVP